MNKKILVSLFLFCLIFSGSKAFAAQTPMLQDYISKNYDDEGEYLQGIIPAIDTEDAVIRPWQLSRWTGIINFPNSSNTTIPNYDVFNVKRAYGDSNFDKENGFGLVFKSPEALGDLFDAIMKGQTKDISTAQLKFYRDTFKDNANDSDFKIGNKFYYTLDRSVPFLRTAGIVQRMGIKFSQTKKISEEERQAIYQVSEWPELKIVQSPQSFTINYSAYGFSDRKVRVIATKKGAFPDLKRIVSLNDGKLIAASKETETGSVKVTDFGGLRKEFGDEIDVVLEDGYGRTAIQSVKLPAITDMDFVPTDLNLTEGNQLWVKFKYVGDDFTSADYISARGIPMLAKVTITGPSGDEQTLQGMYTESSKSTSNGQTYAYYLGKVDLSSKPGKYKIKAIATVNNPNHADRSLEMPAISYENNSIDGEWTREIIAPIDLIAQSVLAAPNSIKEGSSSVVSAKVKNNSIETQTNVLICFYDNDEMIYEANKTLPANEVVTVGPFNWKGSEVGDHNISVKVDPQLKIDDVDRSNNEAYTGCEVTSEEGNPGNCSGTSASKSWKVVYPKIVGYNEYGNAIWNYVRVTYSESLNLTADVDTKQGIATDLNHYKNSDRESRGSWEIIPWSKSHGKDPNEVTRAGYGFEVNVKTKYSTDWETKVPKGLSGTAKKIGGTYYGPEEMYAYIYNTKGSLVGSIAMEKTAGDRNNATWQLPKKTVKYLDGTTFSGRKFFTDVDSPDGKYTVKIVSSKAGKSGFSVCTTKIVEIYGSMYDDTQNLRGTN